MPSSSADVVTRRPEHYARELAKHLGRRVPASLDGDTTLLVIGPGRARVTPLDGVLRLEASADGDAGLREVEDVVGGQLVRLGARRELAVEWLQAGGGVRRMVDVGSAGLLTGGRGRPGRTGPGRTGTAARTGTAQPRPARGPLLRRALQLPAALYRADLGHLLGHRFLLLTHVGRRSGRPHDTVLEVLRFDPATRTAVVMSGFGRSSDWYLNLQHHRARQVVIGRDRFVPEHRELTEDQALAVLEEYESRHRVAALALRIVLSGALGWRYYGTPTDRRRLVAQLPFIAFWPAAT